MNYKEKLITVKDALNLVKSGDDIVTGLACNAADSFLSQLHTIADRVDGVTINTSILMKDYPFCSDPRYSSSFMCESWFFTSTLRNTATLGAASYMPCHLQYCSSKRTKYKKPDLFISAASMPDKHGYISLSLSNSHEKDMLLQSKIRIVEINKNYPRTFGAHVMHIGDFDYLIETDYLPPVSADTLPNEKDRIIGNLIAERINDGDCIQLGIGGIPNAVSDALNGKRDLGVHTELFTTGMMKLAKAGVITNARKNVNNRLSVATFIMGTRELYEYVDDNPSIYMASSAYTNNPYLIAQNDNMVSINTSIEVDLSGQCCSESIGYKQFSGSGGQTDTAVGAQLSKGGRSFIALYSTAMVKDASGERHEVSKIVSTLKPGAIVTLSRNDLDYLVTEYGIVNVKGMSVADRVPVIASIAHPNFREQIIREAYEVGVITKRFTNIAFDVNK